MPSYLIHQSPQSICAPCYWSKVRIHSPLPAYMLDLTQTQAILTMSYRCTDSATGLLLSYSSNSRDSYSYTHSGMGMPSGSSSSHLSGTNRPLPPAVVPRGGVFSVKLTRAAAQIIDFTYTFNKCLDIL